MLHHSVQLKFRMFFYYVSVANLYFPKMVIFDRNYSEYNYIQRIWCFQYGPVFSFSYSYHENFFQILSASNEFPHYSKSITISQNLLLSTTPSTILPVYILLNAVTITCIYLSLAVNPSWTSSYIFNLWGVLRTIGLWQLQKKSFMAYYCTN